MTAVFSVLLSLLVTLGLGVSHLHAMDNRGGPAATIATPAPPDNGGGPALTALDNGGGPALP